MPPIKISHGRVITPRGILADATILIENGVIAEIREGDIDAPHAQVIEAAGHFVSPGFIDLHVHGGGGHDFMDGTAEAFTAIAQLHAQYGTTALTPTTLSCSREDLIECLEAYQLASSSGHSGAAFIGIHLEGPYLSPKQCGAQDPRYLRNPDPREYEALLAGFPCIKRWSAAPELPGALDFGAYCRSKGVLVSLAHTDAVYEEVWEAFEKGYTHATHLYSAMSGVTRRGTTRFAGAIESAYLIDGMTVEMIADGCHLPAPLLQLVYKIKGANKTALITDAMRGAGMPPGDSILGGHRNGLRVIIEDDVAKLPDRSAFAGSVATADRLVRNMVQLAAVPLAEAVAMMTSTPAAIMDIADRKGALVPGKDADIVVFDDSIHIQYTIVGGDIAYSKREGR
jgi:N-acetylglucosamine-6-phosphate deacetylase